MKTLSGTARRSARPGTRRGGCSTAIAIVVGLVALSGCGDDEESAQDRYCAAGESLQSDVESLATLDLLSEGTNGLNSALEQVEDDLEELLDSASATAEDEAATLNESVDGLEDAVAALGGDLTTENVAAIVAAINDVGSAAQGVFATLADC